LPERFYVELNQAALAYELPRRKILLDALALFEERQQALRDQTEGLILPHCGCVSETQARDIYRFLSQYFYHQRNVSKADFKRIAKLGSNAARTKRAQISPKKKQ
jgi:hypothetical protein